MQIPRLREWREARALTQVELAERAGVSSRSVAGYEAGTGARPPTVRKLAEALGVEVADLRGDSEHPLGEAPPSPQPTLNGALEEERRVALEVLSDNLRIHLTGTADRWIHEAETGLAFGSEDAAITFSIEVKSQAAHLYGFVSEVLEPALETLFAGTLTLRGEQRELARTVEHLNKAV